MPRGKVAFVSGGSGAVGSAIVRELAGRGSRVAFSYKSNRAKALQLVEELSAKEQVARPYPLDVLDGKAAQTLSRTIEEELGPVEILVNNAGVTQVLPFAMIEESDWDEIMDVNVKGMFLVTKAFARGMIRRKSGSIVNMGSLAGIRMLEVPVHYAAAKNAVTGFTLALAREFGRYNVRVNAVVPGMLTEGVSVNVPEDKREDYIRHCALSRVGRPEEVARLVAFLASDDSSYISAQAISIDGGI
jgi:NAD(P)-dependent dehydrogenase (short-subunit alcohol dehydrogenase family)